MLVVCACTINIATAALTRVRALGVCAHARVCTRACDHILFIYTLTLLLYINVCAGERVTQKTFSLSLLYVAHRHAHTHRRGCIVAVTHTNQSY